MLDNLDQVLTEALKDRFHFYTTSSHPGIFISFVEFGSTRCTAEVYDIHGKLVGKTGFLTDSLKEREKYKPVKDDSSLPVPLRSANFPPQPEAQPQTQSPHTPH